MHERGGGAGGGGAMHALQLRALAGSGGAELGLAATGTYAVYGDDDDDDDEDDEEED